LIINVVVLLNLLWTDMFLHGTKFVIILALFAICVPIFLTEYYHCVKIIELSKIGKSDILGAPELHKATESLSGDNQPILPQEKPKEFRCVYLKKSFFANIPRDSVLLPWKPASLKKRCWSLLIGIVFDLGIYAILIVSSWLIYSNQPGELQILVAIGLYLIETGTHKVSSIVSTRLDEQLCFEIPQFLIHSFFIDLIFYSYNRNALFLSVSSYVTFAVWQVVHVIDDLYAGLFTYFSWKLRKIPLINKCAIPPVREVKEIVAMQYFGKKYAQIFSNLSLLIYMYLLRYYWNKDLFPYAEEEHMDMLLVYCIAMIVIDIGTGCLTCSLIHLDLTPQTSYLQLIKDFYSYPKIGAIIALLSLLSLQYTYTAIFFTQKL